MDPASRPLRWLTIAVCAALLAAFAALSGSAAATKSPTLDEPKHLLSGYLALRDGDYRLEVANPALWKMWAAAGDVGVDVPVHRDGPVWQRVAWLPVAELPWVRRTLFQTPGTDGLAFVGRGRAMMLIVGVALGVAIAAWAHQLAGPAAAVAGLGLFAFDPTFLAHAPLVKSDVAESLALLAIGWLTWHLGRRVTATRVVGLGLLCGVAVNVKLAGMLAGPIVVALLAGRAAAGRPWPAFGRPMATRSARAGVAAAATIVVAAVAFGVTWGCYRFRYAPSPDRSQSIDVPAIAALAGDGPVPTVARWADRRRLLPQAFTAELLNQSVNVRNWPAYLNGQVYDRGGRWEYYPLAALYKTPLAELAAFAAAGAVGAVALLGRAWRRPGVAWAMACLTVPAGVYAVAALVTPLNVGLRNVLPAYAYADVAAGCCAARAWRRRPVPTGVVAGALLAAGAVTAVAAWPDYLPFFNAAVGGPRAGFHLLGDANLDWGQDVNALAAWQRSHPDVPLYVDLFTSVDPKAVYGLRYENLWRRTSQGEADLRLPSGPAVLAVSATYLQGLYDDPTQQQLLAVLARRRPREVLHGTIYLYDVAPGQDWTGSGP